MSRIYFILLFLVTFLSLSLEGQKTETFAASSVLSGGKWFKIAVTKEGIYRIDYSMLRQAGLADPADPEIFSGNAGQLSYYNDGTHPDDLEQISIYIEKGTDGIFNDGDYILFYGQGTGRWKFNNATSEYIYSKHNYSDTAFYFLTSGKAPVKSVITGLQPSGSPTHLSSESDALFIHELDNENLIKSGREWYQSLSSLSGLTINPGFSDIVVSEKMQSRIRVLARASVSTLFRFYEGTSLRKSIQVQNVNLLNYTGTYAAITDSLLSFYPSSPTPLFELKYFTNGEPGARGWVDFIKLQARKRNSYNGTATWYSDYRTTGTGNLAEFTIRSPSYNPEIWDVTDPENPFKVSYNKTGETITFRSQTDDLKRFIAFSGTSVLSPSIKKIPVPNQDLHGSHPADMIIVTHPLFRQYAEKLALLHNDNSGLVSLVVTPEQIYNEFSGGVPDIAAIRNFVRMKYVKQSGSSRPLKYLLLFGDGSYENRTMPPLNPNFIPTYQSQVSNIVVSSFTSDDFYGLLDHGEGESDGTEDIGIGRLPAADTAQAGIMVRKIKGYISPSNSGIWKNIICIAADDEDGNTHMSDAEGLADILNDSIPLFNVEKIYLDAFRQITSSNGQTYPDVNTAINNRIKEGCLIFNYVGHGSETGLAHERVMKNDDIREWNNGSKLPLFITATCEFSRFDDIDINVITKEMTPKTSAGESVLLKENGGAIALMSTTRVVYSAPNYFLNRNIYDFAFDRDSSGASLRLGDIIRIAKNYSGNSTNKRNFSLLGDPAVRLAYPWHGNVITDSINHISVNAGPDSLKALSKVTLAGHIEYNSGMIDEGFNGIVSALVFEKPSQVKSLANDGGQPMKFETLNNILFSGKTKAKDGKFSFSFIVPRDINYNYGNGKISYYASEDERDMGGFFTEVVIGGFAEIIESDTTGPVIRLFMNDTLFRDGGLTDRNPRMLAIIEDPGGINTTGSGIGHDITAWLDDDRSNPMVLNNFFENDFDNYMKGTIVYDLSLTGEGRHTLRLKAWDNFNNSAEEVVHFISETNGRFILTNLISYPNPAAELTKITAGHNRPDRSIEVTVSIYDGTGKLVRILRSDESFSGYQLSPIEWDLKNSGGSPVRRGIYLYKVSAITSDGEKAASSGRIIIL